MNRYAEGVFWVTFVLLSLGLVMVASSSMPIAMQLTADPFYYFGRQILFLTIGLIAAGLVYHIPIAFYQKNTLWILGISLLILALLLIPGVGHSVNGSKRWISLGLFHIQVAEIAKLGFIIYFASFCTQYSAQIKAGGGQWVLGMLPVATGCGLILLQPDFGSAVVIMASVMGLLFLIGVALWQYIGIILVVVAAFSALAISSPYRFARLTTFLNPWAHQFDSGYQLTQALIALGRGGWWGLGLGSGVQKLFYLPEAHTDFIFAVIAEELGLVGASCVLLLYLLFGFYGAGLAYQAFKAGKPFHGALSFGITLWLCFQALIAMGVNIGLLPTKGLTLPFISSGGSSLLICLIGVAILLRVGEEI